MKKFSENKQLADESVNMCSAHLLAMFPPCADKDKKCWKKLEKLHAKESGKPEGEGKKGGKGGKGEGKGQGKGQGKGKGEGKKGGKKLVQEH